MAYGTYIRKVVDSGSSDTALNTAINLSAVAGVLANTVKTAQEPMCVDRFGYIPTTVFAYAGILTQGALGLFKYPAAFAAVDLASSIALCNSLTTVLKAHAADAVIHKAVDATNFTAVLTPPTVVTDLASLMIQVNLLQTAYAAHAVDENGGTPTYHVVQDTAGSTAQALANSTPVSTLAGTMAKLLDMVLKYNLHDVDIVAHHFGYYHPAGKVLLATMNLVNGDQPCTEYVVDVENVVLAATAPATGLGPLGIADLVPGDKVAIEVTVAATDGSTPSGTYQPFFCWHNRAETESIMSNVVNRTVIPAPSNDSMAP